MIVDDTGCSRTKAWNVYQSYAERRKKKDMRRLVGKLFRYVMVLRLKSRLVRQRKHERGPVAHHAHGRVKPVRSAILRYDREREEKRVDTTHKRLTTNWLGPKL